MPNLTPKIENEAVMAPKQAPVRHRYEVLISFDGLDKGDVFSEDAGETAWADRHVRSGYLRKLDG